MINIGTLEHPNIGQFRIEMTNQAAFMQAMMRINRIAKERGVESPEKLWRIRTVGPPPERPRQQQRPKFQKISMNEVG